MDNFEITTFIGHLLIYMVVLVFAISAHEAGHAWMSKRFGDDTAYLLGRVTLNPVVHTDILGTLILPALSFILSAVGGAYGAIPIIGWGKPTPVNPRHWTNYKTANFWVSIAGILANLTIAVVSFAVIRVLTGFGIVQLDEFFISTQNPLVIFLQYSLFLNISLAIFNLLPIPPLDGSKILSNFLPAGIQAFFDSLQQFGFIILMMLIYAGVLRMIMNPVFYFVYYLLVLGS